MNYADKVTVKMVDVMGDDLTPILAAKVSFDRDDTNAETDVVLGWHDVELPCLYREQPLLSEKQQGLISYLARGMSSKEFEALSERLRASTDLSEVKELLWTFRKTPTHAAPFGHCFASFVVEAPVFVARQLVKHEYLRMSEVSRRYVKGDPVYYKPATWHGIAEDVKQGSGKPLENPFSVVGAYLEAVRTADQVYHELLLDVSPEEARMVLPLCHMTRWWWSGSLDAFANMCNLRLDPHAQSLTREVAKQISDQMVQAFPYSWKALVLNADKC